jgi:hypothetical protein
VTYNLILANSTSSSNIPGSPFLLLFNFEIAASRANRRDSSFLRRDLYSDTVDCACSGCQDECEARVESMGGTCGEYERYVWVAEEVLVEQNKEWKRDSPRLAIYPSCNLFPNSSWAPAILHRARPYLARLSPGY